MIIIQNEIQIFSKPEFGEIRTVVIDGEPWFVGRDVAIALGYAKPQNAVRDYVEQDDTLKQGIIDSLKREQQTVVINESGLYSLIFGSKLESAKKFKKWVTSEVLPSIRKTGSYSEPKPKSPMELLQLHYEAIKEVNTKVETLEEKVLNIENGMPAFSCDTKDMQTEVKKKAVDSLGGFQSNAYNDKSTRGYVFADIQMMLRREFGVRRYEEIKHNRVPEAINLIREYRLPLVLKERIDMVNAQQSLF